MSARLRVSERCGSPAWVPPTPDPGDAAAVPGIGAPRRLSRYALATGTPTRLALSLRPSLCPGTQPPPGRPPSRLAACALGDVCGPGVRPRRLRRVQTTRT